MRPLLLYAVLLLCATENCFSATTTDKPDMSNTERSPRVVNDLDNILPCELLAEISHHTPTEDRFSFIYASRAVLEAVPKPILQKCFIDACKKNIVAQFLFFRNDIDKDTRNLGYIAAVRAGSAQAVRTLLTRFEVDPNADDTTFPFQFSPASRNLPYGPEILVPLLPRVIPHSPERHIGDFFDLPKYNEEIHLDKIRLGEDAFDLEEDIDNPDDPTVAIEMQWTFKHQHALAHSFRTGNAEMVKALLIANVDARELIRCLVEHDTQSDLVVMALLKHDSADPQEMFHSALNYGLVKSLKVILEDDSVDPAFDNHRAILEVTSRASPYTLHPITLVATLELLSECEKVNPLSLLLDSIRSLDVRNLDRVFKYFLPLLHSKDDQQALVNSAVFALDDPSILISSLMQGMSLSLKEALELLRNAVESRAFKIEPPSGSGQREEVRGLLADMEWAEWWLQENGDAPPRTLEDALHYVEHGLMAKKTRKRRFRTLLKKYLSPRAKTIFQNSFVAKWI